MLERDVPITEPTPPPVPLTEPVQEPPIELPGLEYDEAEFGYGKKIRDKVLKRDNYQSQLQHYSEEKGFYKNETCVYDADPCSHLEVHHIDPTRSRTSKGKEQDNSLENLITVTKCEHVGVCPSERIINGRKKR